MKSCNTKHSELLQVELWRSSHSARNLVLLLLAPHLLLFGSRARVHRRVLASDERVWLLWLMFVRPQRPWLLLLMLLWVLLMVMGWLLEVLLGMTLGIFHEIL